MSILIELEQELEMTPQQTHRFLKQNLKAYFRSFSQCKNINDTGKQLSFSMKASERTFRLSTLWKFTLFSPTFTMDVLFYHQNQKDFLKADTERMKLQTSILIRKINSDNCPYMFKLENSSGCLKVCYCIDWNQFYSIFHKKQEIKSLVKYAMMFTWKYNQMLMFLQPVHLKRTEKKSNAIQKMNKYRYILNLRKQKRNLTNACMDDFQVIKNSHINFPRHKISQLEHMYMQNILFFYQSDFGLEQDQIRTEKLTQNMREIQKNEYGKSSYLQQTGTKQPIVLGLYDIVPMTQNNKPYSVEGAHSKIYRNKFKYSFFPTLNQSTINLDKDMWKEQLKCKTGELTYKVCNKTYQTSINSFKNQLALLKYMQKSFSPYIAKYYLKNRVQGKQWNQNDTIYMSSYKQNLYSLFKNHKSIGIKTKLNIAYYIAKGLCFLNHRQIVHRDFKAQNILVDGLLNPKIIDFGSCVPHYNSVSFQVADKRLLTTPGLHIHYNDLSIQYDYIRAKMSKSAYQQHSLFDIYGFGKILSFIFFGSTTPPTPESILGSPYFQFHEHMLFLIQICLKIDPDERPTCGEAAAYIGALNDLMKNVIVPEQNIPKEGLMEPNQ